MHNIRRAPVPSSNIVHSSKPIVYIEPQTAIVLEKIDDFKKFEQSSRRFLQFEEQLLTDNMRDQNHYRTHRLDFNPKQKVDAALYMVYDYLPVSCDKLKEENMLLYVRLKAEGIIQ